MPSRRHWIAPLLAVAALCGVASGAVAMLPLPPGARAILVLAVVVLAPVLAWQRGGRSIFAAEQWLPAWLHLLAALFVLSLLSVGLRTGLLALGASLLLALARPIRSARSKEPAAPPTALVLLLCCLLAGWMAATPSPVSLRADGPAHLGAVHDALGSDRWLPPDLSVHAGADRSDPRFGVGHGLLAAVAEAAGVAPEIVLKSAPTLLSPLWFVAHLLLFANLGLPAVWAVVSALLFTVGGAGGRSFGLWLVSYPGNIALLVATFAMAGWLRALRRKTSALVPIALLALSARIHPFGWWLFLAVTAHLVLLPRHPDMKGASRGRIFLDCLVGAGLGVLVLLPALLEQGVGGEGPHFAVTDALYLGGPIFVVDPTVVARWSSWAAVLMFPVLLLGWRRPHTVGEQYGQAASLAVWSIALNPLVMPWAWSLVSYLTVRMGRGVPTTALALLLLLGLLRSRLAWWRRATLLLFASFVLVAQLHTALSAVTTSHAEQRRFSVEQLRPVADGLDQLGVPNPWTDPRTAYGLRALRGGSAPIYPLAHASPSDAELEHRLASLRRLHDPDISYSEWVAIVRREGIGQLLLNENQEALAMVGDYGWVASDERANALASRLEALGLHARRIGEDATLFSLSALPEFGWEISAAPVDSVPRLDPPVSGVGLRVVGMRVPAAASPGDTITVQVQYERDETVAGDLPWQAVFLRLQGEMWEAPAPLRPIGKPIRKLFLERSGRSENRFGLRWFPLDGLRPPSAWEGGEAYEARRLVIPPRAKPGRYGLQLTVQTVPWRRNRDLRDYLSDRDRYSSIEYGVIEIRPAR